MANNNQEEIRKKVEDLPLPPSPLKKILNKVLLILGVLFIFFLTILILLYRR